MTREQRLALRQEFMGSDPVIYFEDAEEETLLQEEIEESEVPSKSVHIPFWEKKGYNKNPIKLTGGIIDLEEDMNNSSTIIKEAKPVTKATSKVINEKHKVL